MKPKMTKKSHEHELEPVNAKKGGKRLMSAGVKVDFDKDPKKPNPCGSAYKR